MGWRQIRIDIDVNRAIEAGRRSFDESENDILRRLLARRRPGKPRTSASTSPDVRARGSLVVELSGTRIPAANLKDAYRQLLLALADRDDRFLERFGEEASRSRRFVARSAADLYRNSPHLAGDHARELTPGWYFDSNLSAEQIGRRARIAARVAGLHYGADVAIRDGFREI